MFRAAKIFLVLTIAISSLIPDLSSSTLCIPPERDPIDEFGGGVSTGLPSNGDYNCVAVGDIDEDGNIDMVIGAEQNYGTSGNSGLFAFFGDGNGGWSQTTIADSGSYAAIEIADCDEDGYNEVYASYQEYSNGVGAWEWTGSAFSQSGISSPFTSGAVSFIRIDNVSGGDGLDLVIASQNGMRYYESNGRSPILWTQYSTGLSSNGFFTGMDLTDLNNDGLLDIAAGQYGDGILLYQQSAQGRSWIDVSSTLPDVENSGRILGLVSGDVNGDGNTDLIYSRRTSPNGMYMLLGNGGGAGGNDLRWSYLNSSWTNQPDGTYYQMHLQDVDRDGDPDLLAPCEDYGLHLYLGNGADDPGLNFKWAEVTGKGLPSNMKFFGGNYLDFDSDGDRDIAGCTWGNGAMVFRNNITQPENPTARAGSDQTIVLRNTTYLNGTGSSDAQDCPDGDIEGTILGYDWNLTSQPYGSTMVDADLTPSDKVAKPSFAPTIAGNYTFSLSVSDTTGHRSLSEDAVRIAVVMVNTPPTADAGMDRTVHTGDNVTLDGSKSSDPEDELDLLAFEWVVSSDNPTNVFLDDDSSVDPWFIVPETLGNYSFNLTVTDSSGSASEPDRITIQAVLPPNMKPIANAGPDLRAISNSTVLLNGSLSHDPDGEITDWSWECASHSIEIASSEPGYASFLPERPGLYLIDLSVKDERMEWSAPDRMVVEVIPDNQAPIANAGRNRTVHRNATVVLNGSMSIDPDGTITAWNWRPLTHPGTVMMDENSSGPSFEAGRLGEQIFSLRVMDDDGAWSLPDTVKITVVIEEENITDPIENAPPSVELLYPRSGMVLAGTTEISWAASDPDGDMLTASIMLYDENGSFAVLLSGPLPISSGFSWNTSAHENGPYSIRISVSDGMESAFDTSGFFIIENEKPPGNQTDDDPPEKPIKEPIDDDKGPIPIYVLFIALAIVGMAILIVFGIAVAIRIKSRRDSGEDWDEE